MLSDKDRFNTWVRAQHIGELCTFGPVKDRLPIWVIKFEDASRVEAYFNNEVEAIDFYLKVSNSWNCTLLSTVMIMGNNRECNENHSS